MKKQEVEAIKLKGGSMETNVEVISINGMEYVKKDSVKKEDVKGVVKIVILQRGWVMIGILERSGNDCKLHRASIIRKWGTTKGLGELALEGKKQNTVLDTCGGVVRFDYLTVVATIDCKEDLWKNAL